MYSIKDAENYETSHPKPFIIANERQKRDGTIGRTYTVFSSFTSFLKNRGKYPNCHELIANHKNIPVKKYENGRLVFDFDLPFSEFKVPKNFKEIVEFTIGKTAKKYYKNIDYKNLTFVWSRCENTKKISKHLTVENILFKDWFKDCLLFYKFFKRTWNNYEGNDWITTDKLIDCQIVRKKASLRMVGSRKIGGNELTLDNPEHTLEQSLIRIYRGNKSEYVHPILRSKYIEKEVETFKIKKVSGNACAIDAVFEKRIYDIAFQKCDEEMPGIFTKGKINGRFLTLMRNKSGKCPLSNKHHDNENSYCVISHDLLADKYTFRFGCYRKCNEHIQTKYIGFFQE